MKRACFHILQPSCMETKRRKCYFSVFSPSIHSLSIHLLTTITPKRKVHLQNYMTNIIKIDQIWEELSGGTSHFVAK